MQSGAMLCDMTTGNSTLHAVAALQTSELQVEYLTWECAASQFCYLSEVPAALFEPHQHSHCNEGACNAQEAYRTLAADAQHFSSQSCSHSP